MILGSFFVASYVAIWFVVVAEAIALFLIFRQFGVMYMNTREGIENSGISPGARAPDFLLPTSTGDQIALSDVLRSAGGALIVFGAPHCQPCHLLLPDLHRFAESYAGDLATLFISRGTRDENQYFAGTFGRPTTLLFDDAEGHVADLYKSRVTPFAFALDRQGRVRAKGLANSYDQLVKMADAVREPASRSNDGDLPSRNTRDTLVKEV